MWNQKHIFWWNVIIILVITFYVGIFYLSFYFTLGETLKHINYWQNFWFVKRANGPKLYFMSTPAEIPFSFLYRRRSRLPWTLEHTIMTSYLTTMETWRILQQEKEFSFTISTWSTPSVQGLSTGTTCDSKLATSHIRICSIRGFPTAFKHSQITNLTSWLCTSVISCKFPM